MSACKEVFSSYQHGSGSAALDPADISLISSTNEIKEIELLIQEYTLKIKNIHKNDKLSTTERMSEHKALREMINFLKEDLYDLKQRNGYVVNTSISSNTNTTFGHKNIDTAYTIKNSNNTIPNSSSLKCYKNKDVDSILISQIDEFGQYYSCRNLQNQEVRFYIESESTTLRFKLKTLEDFPSWGNILKYYLKQWNFDDITTLERNTVIDNIENTILKRILKKSLIGEMKRYKFDDLSAIELFDEIKSHYTDHFSRGKKDILWKDILIDVFCSDRIQLRNILHDMIHIEIWSQSKDDPVPLTNRFLNTKIKQCLHYSLSKQILFFSFEEQITLQDCMNPKEYVRVIERTIKNFKEENNIFDEVPNRCENCKSYLHHSKNCKKK